jgi:tetratricopeptide (TPR) repeat protein
MMRIKRSTLAVVAAVVMVSGCSRSPQAKEAKYLEKGRKEYQQKNYAVAVLHFKNAVQAQPRDAEPYYQLGLTYLALSDFNAAASCFRKAAELNPKHAGAQLKLAELMATSRSKEVVQEAQKRSQGVLALLPGDPDALDVLAVTELKLGKPESAEAHLEQALKTSPSHLKSSVALARAKLARKDTAGAEEVLKQAVAQAPRSPEPRVYLGGLYLALGKKAEAEQEYRHALEIDPKHGPALLALAAMQVRAGQAEQADRTYQQISALPDKRYRPMHALFLFRSGKRDHAVAEFEKLYKADLADRTLRTDLVSVYLALNRVADAESILTAALKKNGRDVDALMQRSRIYLGSGKYAEAQADLIQVLHFRDTSAEAHYLLSKVKQGRGEAAIQRQELGEALRLDPTFGAARVELAQALITTGGAQQALGLLEQTPEEQKSAIPIVVQRNWALLALGRTAEARKGIDQVLAAGKSPEALLQDCALKLTQKDYAGARVSAEGVLAQNPQETRALNLLVQSYASQKQMPLGLQKAREYAARQPASAAVQLFLGQLLFANGDRAGARQALEAAKKDNPALIAADLSLANLDTAEGKRDEARKRLSAVVSAHPDNVVAQNLWAQLETMDAKTGAAIERYRKVLALDEKNVGALNNLAYLLVDAKQPDEALKYAQQAKELAPENPAIDDTLGWTYYRKGMYSLAVTHLRSAVSKQATALRQYHLAMACLKAGDTSQGRSALQAALKIDPNLPEAQVARQMFGGGLK